MAADATAVAIKVFFIFLSPTQVTLPRSLVRLRAGSFDLCQGSDGVVQKNVGFFLASRFDGSSDRVE